MFVHWALQFLITSRFVWGALSPVSLVDSTPVQLLRGFNPLSSVYVYSHPCDLFFIFVVMGSCQSSFCHKSSSVILPGYLIMPWVSLKDLFTNIWIMFIIARSRLHITVLNRHLKRRSLALFSVVGKLHATLALAAQKGVLLCLCILWKKIFTCATVFTNEATLILKLFYFYHCLLSCVNWTVLFCHNSILPSSTWSSYVHL